MIKDKKFDFSEESDIKEALLAKIRRKFIYEKGGSKNGGEMCDEDLKLVAGGEKKTNCPFGADCSNCEKKKNGECKL